LKLKLPRYQCYYDLLEEELRCKHCGGDLILIGHDESFQFEIVPTLLYLCQHIRAKYSCQKCQTVKMPEKPISPIPKSRAGASLLTEVIINKFQRHLPMYRQSQIFHSMGVDLGDNTLGRWSMQAGEMLLPLYHAMWDTIRKQKYLQVDETPINVLKPNRKGYLWCYYAPFPDNKGLIIYDFHLSRGSEVPNAFLKEFKGLLQVDGYQGYGELEKREDITRIGCLTHARRKFATVLKITKNKKCTAAEVIERMKPLYAIEKYARENKLNHHTRKRLRQKKAWPILKALKHWLKQEKPKVPPKSQLGNAIDYMLNQWPRIIQYLRHGIAEIDTNIVENLIRPTAIGKKNYLFFKHEESGAINGLLYSLVQSALLNGLEPRTYLHYVLTKVHDLRRKKINPNDLLPHVIDRTILEAFAEKQIEHTTLVLNKAQPPPKA
jgi:transposase